MGFVGGHKIVLHAEVKGYFWTFKPTPAPFDQRSRFSDLPQPQQFPIKLAGFILTVGRNSQLNMVESGNHGAAPLVKVLYHNRKLKAKQIELYP
jgi:hypothetical protein